MWGDPKRAASLDVGDTLATLLFQVSSPVHIPWGDTRWQELLTGYDVWIHAESIEGNESTSIITQACEMMAKHAFISSNLAALSLHVTRMIRDLTRDISKSKSKINEYQTDDFSLRISRVGKARATAGALQLLRLLSHSVVVRCCKKSIGNESRAESKEDLEEVFTYHTRGDLPYDQLTSGPLLNAVLDFVVILGKCADALRTPEVYDTIVLAFQLLFVLCGTQLYQDFESSSSRPDDEPYAYSFLDQLFESEKEPIDICNETAETDNKSLNSFFCSWRDSVSNNSSRGRHPKYRIWTAQSILETCLRWQAIRPLSPDRSIAHYHHIMAQSAVAPRSREMRSAGMYESDSIVHAATPGSPNPNGGSPDLAAPPRDDDLRKLNESKTQHSLILDATRGVITLGSTIILLPLRLVSRVFEALIQSKESFNRDLKSIMSRKFDSSTLSRTKDVLWLSDAILADLSSCLVLLLINNNRRRENPFREELQALSDNRWDHLMESRLPDLPSLDTISSNRSSPTDVFRIQKGRSDLRQSGLTLNFESLFESFGRTLHTEVGSLLLYTLLQTSDSFAKSLAVRSDLDTVVLPLLRTLYFSSQSNTFMASDYAAHKKKGSMNTLNIRNCPFRSQSQLYVIIILLLLFSQDLSFGRDAFRRIYVPHVLWYKERQLRHINLGSVLVLTILRALIFNLQRLHDPFLLSNCCAILSNLSSATTDLHEYAAMRLVSVAISVMKRYSKLSDSSNNGGQNRNDEEEDDLTTPLRRYSEVAHHLLSTISDCLSPRKIEQNLQVIYAIVYYQADFANVFRGNLYPARQRERILNIAQAASTLIQEASARSAPEALKVLESQVEALKSAVEKKRRKRESISDYTFTYEEDTDPERFFVPYVWEVIVCVVTSSSIEWKKNDIRAFQLLEPEETASVPQQPTNSVVVSGSFDTDAEDFV